MKIFLRFNRISYTGLAREIEQMSGIPTNRQQVYEIVIGKMKMPRIRTAIADLLGESVENIWPKETSGRKRSKPKDGNSSTESSSILNSQPAER